MRTHGRSLVYIMLGVIVMAILAGVSTGQTTAVPVPCRERPDTSAAASAVASQPPTSQREELRPAIDSLLQVNRSLLREAGSTKFLYLLSAAAQALATVMTLIFTVTLVVAQLVAPYGLHMSKRAFSSRNLARMSVFIAATLFSLVALLSGNGVLAIVSAVLSLICMAVLIDYFWRVSREMEPRAAIRDLRAEATALATDNSGGAVAAALKLETMAYGALAKGDYELVQEALEAIGSTVSALAGHGQTDLALALRDDIKALLIEAGARPKPTQEMLLGLINGLATTKTGFYAMYAVLLEILDSVLASYEWPRAEEAYSAVYRASGRYLELLVDAAPDRAEDVVSAVDKVGSRLVSTWRRVVSAQGSAKNYGCGNAAATLQGILAAAARKAARSTGVNARVVTAFTRAMLDIGRREQGFRPLMHNAPYAWKRVADTLRKAGPYLDEADIRRPLADLTADWDTEPAVLASTWLGLATVFADKPAASLVDVALEKFSESLANCPDIQAEELVTHLRRSAPKLVAAGYGSDNHLWRAILALWSRRALTTNTAASVFVAFAQEEDETRPQGGRFLAMYQMADSMLELAMNGSRPVGQSETTELVANWLVAAAFYAKSHVTSARPQLPPELAGQNRDARKAVTIRERRVAALQTVENWSAKLRPTVTWLLEHPGAAWFVH